MCQYANVPIGCAIMPDGDKHNGSLVNYSIRELYFKTTMPNENRHIGTLENY